MRGIIRAGGGTGKTGLRQSSPLLGALVIAAALKAGLLIADVVPFNADEAVVALMARHILQGARPIFFYGQAYLGSLDAWLIAGAFGMFGESVGAIRGVQAVLYLGTLTTTYLLGLEIYARRWIAGAAALFLALPTVLVTLYTTATLGGYGETILIGNVLLLLGLKLASRGGGWMTWLALGLLGGLGFWGFPLILVYLLPVITCVLVTARPLPEKRGAGLVQWLTAGMGFGVGASPWLWFTLTQGLSTFTELSGSAIAGASSAHPVFAVFQHLFYFLLFGPTVIFGMRPPWAANFLALPLAPLALVLYAALLAFLVRRVAQARDGARLGRRLLAGCCATLVAAFVLSPFGADPSGRYFLPLAAPLALFMAEMLHGLRPRRRWLANGLALGLVTFNFWGTVQSAAAFPPGLTTQFDAIAQVDQRPMPELIEFLRAQGETRGYSNYWVAFPLAFLSGEELVYAARLPYHEDFRYTSRDDRYAPYSQAVEASRRAAFITTNHPRLDARIRSGLGTLGVAFREAQIGDVHIFYALSRKVIPEELGLGADCCP